MLYNSEHFGDEMLIGIRVEAEALEARFVNGSICSESGSQGLSGGMLFTALRPLSVRPLSIWNRAIGDPRAKKFSHSKSRRRFCSLLLSPKPLLDMRWRVPGRALPRLDAGPCSASLCRHRMSNRIALPRECPTKLTLPENEGFRSLNSL